MTGDHLAKSTRIVRRAFAGITAATVAGPDLAVDRSGRKELLGAVRLNRFGKPSERMHIGGAAQSDAVFS